MSLTSHAMTAVSRALAAYAHVVDEDADEMHSEMDKLKADNAALANTGAELRAQAVLNADEIREKTKALKVANADKAALRIARNAAIKRCLKLESREAALQQARANAEGDAERMEAELDYLREQAYTHWVGKAEGSPGNKRGRAESPPFTGDETDEDETA